MEAIFAALEAEGTDWAEGQMKMLRSKSPQSLKVSLRQMRAGARMVNFAEVMMPE